MEFKIISFNIRCCDDPKGHSIKERALRLKDVLSAYGADILCFQEYRPTWKKHIKKHYLRQYKMYFKYRGFFSREATPILWKKNVFKCIKKGVFWLADTPEKSSYGWDELYNVPRICTYVILKHRFSGKLITVMNTHFGFGENGQIKSAKLIIEYAKKISGNPTVAVGDFNMTAGSGGYKAMTEYFNDTCSIQSLKKATYHGYNKKEASHIDFCFVDDCFELVSEKVIEDTPGGKFLSDHNGLFIQLKV